MSRYTTAYSSFVERLTEIRALQKTAATHAKKRFSATEMVQTQALCRASIILLSSHVEGYVSELGELIVKRICDKGIKKSVLPHKFRYYFSKDLILAIIEANDPAKRAQKVLELFSRDHDIWGPDDSFHQPLSVERFGRGIGNPTFENIHRFLGRFGYTDYRHDLATLLTVSYQPCVNMINHVVALRNKIAHGDKVISATPGDIGDMVRLVRQFCIATDQVVAHWFRNEVCSIR